MSYKSLTLLIALGALLFGAAIYEKRKKLRARQAAASSPATLTNDDSYLLGVGGIPLGTQFSILNPDILAPGVASSGVSPQALFFGGSTS